MNKVAFITMDVESFYDAICLQKKRITPQKEFTCANEVERFVDYLNSENIKSTLFLNLDFLKECYDGVKKAIDTGHEIALHSLTHHNLTRVKNDDFSFMIDESKKIMTNHLNKDVKGFRFPCFHFRNEQMDILKNNGFIYDSSVMKEVDKSYKKINDVVYEKDGFYEFKLNRSRLFLKKVVFSGGGLIRMLPWGFAKKKIRKLMQKQNAYLFYIHPFELYDGDLPDYKSLSFYDRIYIKRNRKDWFNHIKEIIDMLKEEGYVFMTMPEFIKLEEEKHE